MFGLYAEDFAAIDVNALRSIYFTVAEAPPGFSALSTAAAGEDDTSPLDHVCELLCADGSVCGAKFKSKMALLTHMRKSVGGGTWQGVRNWAVLRHKPMPHL